MTPFRTPRPGSSWLAVALILSLGANVFIGGYLVGQRGAVWRDLPPHDRPPPGPPNPAFFLRMLAERLPPADAALARDMADRFENVEDPAATRREEAHAPLRAALLADPFVPDDMNAAFIALDTADMASRARLKDTLIELATRISPEGRRAMAMFRPGPPGPPPTPEGRER